jgi:hypothetical protein
MIEKKSIAKDGAGCPIFSGIVGDVRAKWRKLEERPGAE